MNLIKVQRMIVGLKEVYKENFGLLSELDAKTGDGDHGASMVRGFTGVATQLGDKAFANYGELMGQVGRVLMKEIGGTCGPLFATFFMKGGNAIREESELTTHGYRLFVENGAAGVAELGKTEKGDKTMYDAMITAAEALIASDEAGKGLAVASAKAADAALAGAESTKEMQAKKGRGRYQGDASIGAMDAGAMSVALMMRAFAKAMEDN